MSKQESFNCKMCRYIFFFPFSELVWLQEKHSSEKAGDGDAEGSAQDGDFKCAKRLWQAGRARGIDAETTVSGRAACGWHRIKYISPSTYHYNEPHHTNGNTKQICSPCSTREDRGVDSDCTSAADRTTFESVKKKTNK